MAAAIERDGIPVEKIVGLAALVGEQDHDLELEDVLSSCFYHQAVREAYPDKEVTMPTNNQGKRTKAYAEAFKREHIIGFNKRRVAEKMKKLLGENRADDESKEGLRKVTDGILKALDKQAVN